MQAEGEVPRAGGQERAVVRAREKSLRLGRPSLQRTGTRQQRGPVRPVLGHRRGTAFRECAVEEVDRDGRCPNQVVGVGRLLGVQAQRDRTQQRLRSDVTRSGHRVGERAPQPLDEDRTHGGEYGVGVQRVRHPERVSAPGPLDVQQPRVTQVVERVRRAQPVQRRALQRFAESDQNERLPLGGVQHVDAVAEQVEQARRHARRPHPAPDPVGGGESTETASRLDELVQEQRVPAGPTRQPMNAE
jgi:hypothetical protein